MVPLIGAYEECPMGHTLTDVSLQVYQAQDPLAPRRRVP